MKVRSFIKVAAIAGLVLAVGMPAEAGPYRFEANIVRGARLNGTVQAAAAQFMQVSLDIRQLEGVSVDGAASLLPTPPPPDAAQEPLRNSGCVSMIAPGGRRDAGCTVVSATINIDPAMLTGTLVMGFESDVFEGDLIDVTLLLQGEGNIGPSIEGDDPSVSQDEVDVLTDVLLTRNVQILAGSVRSRGLGAKGVGYGGPVVSADMAQMFTGIQLLSDTDPGCLIQFPAPNCFGPI